MHIKNTVSTIAIEHITVVIPVYNEQAYIRQCLEALKRQTLKRYRKNLRMPISARPFRSPHKMPGRYMAGFRSVFLHWPEQAPWKRFIK